MRRQGFLGWTAQDCQPFSLKNLSSSSSSLGHHDPSLPICLDPYIRMDDQDQDETPKHRYNLRKRKRKQSQIGSMPPIFATAPAVIADNSSNTNTNTNTNTNSQNQPEMLKLPDLEQFSTRSTKTMTRSSSTRWIPWTLTMAMTTSENELK